MTTPLSPLPTAPSLPADAALAGAVPGGAMPVPVRWMPALFRHTRVDARLYQAEVLERACAARIAAHGQGAHAWVDAIHQSAAEAWAMVGALEAACWGLPDVADLDVAAALGAWRQCRPRTPVAQPGGLSASPGEARVWLPACPDAALALRLNQWLAAAQPALPWLVTCSPVAEGQAAMPPVAAPAGIAWRAHRVLHEPMAGRFDLIIAPALLAGVLPHVQRRLLAQWARLLGAGAAAGGQPPAEPGLLWVGSGPACETALAQGWRRAGPGPLLRPPLAVADEAVRGAERGVSLGATLAAVAAARAAAPVPAAPAAPSVPAPAGRPAQAALGADAAPALKTEQLLLALAREALVLRFEPRRSIDQGRRVAVAAVLRQPEADRRLPETEAAWQAARHPAHAVLLGQWALQLACREAGRWSMAGGDALDLVVPVVASQLRQPGWVNQLCQTLEQTGLPPERLTLSLGARSLVQPSPLLLRALVDIRRLGVRLSVARLKAGDALLDCLQDLPVDELQIDSRLLDDVPGSPLAEQTVRRIAALGRRLGLRVVADGVAREAQRRWLAALACDAYQGPLAGPALAAQASLRSPYAA